ncbi:PREDICTED: uncharacterized protein LOC106814198 [Priapulus caudatus]|uniref:Uncharacterized protein LOC106814198 n=1 Tax=Priapulus caudatus TaxID=37621 RepID=A0ABM1EP62_PRICU|nr:PREDICTED: uncharacterized protein LOC106814198 [Priapulus caudatus]
MWILATYYPSDDDDDESASHAGDDDAQNSSDSEIIPTVSDGIVLNKGNFRHNYEVLEKKKGMLIPKYRQKNTSSKSLVPCEFCLGMYSRKVLWEHQTRCCKRPTDANTKGRSGIQSGRLLLPVESANRNLYKNVLVRMIDDNIKPIIEGDGLIMKLANRLYAKYGHESQNHQYISQTLRQVGRLLSVTKKLGTPLHTIEECLNPGNWEVLIEGVKNLAEYDEETHTYTRPSLALKVGYSLKKCAKILRSESLMTDDEVNLQKRNAATNFLTLYEDDWGDRISAKALSTMDTNRYNSPKLLPLMTDVVKLQTYLQKEAKAAAQELAEGTDSYARLAKLCLTQLILFNRRRSGEAQRVQLSELNKALKTEHELEEEDMCKVLSKFEMHLLKSHLKIETKGKRGRKVPILLPDTLASRIRCLVEHREKAGVMSNFGRKGEGYTVHSEHVTIMVAVGNLDSWTISKSQQMFSIFTDKAIAQSQSDLLAGKKSRGANAVPSVSAEDSWLKLIASWKDVKKFYNADNSLPVKLAPKITAKHISATIFTDEVYAGMHILASIGRLGSQAHMTADFLKLVNNVFDLLNVRAYGKTAAPFTEHSDKQLNTLLDLKAQVQKWHMIVKGKKYRPPSFDALIEDFNVVISIHEDLVVKGPLEFLLTGRLNQDCIENVFPQIRSKGGHRFNPSAREFRFAYRNLSSNFILASLPSANCVYDNDIMLSRLRHLSSEACSIHEDHSQKPASKRPRTKQSSVAQKELEVIATADFETPAEVTNALAYIWVTRNYMVAAVGFEPTPPKRLGSGYRTTTQLLSELEWLTGQCKVTSILMDRIVLGVRDTATQQALLKERELTLEHSINICRAAENATRQCHALRQETIPDSVSMDGNLRTDIVDAVDRSLGNNSSFRCSDKVIVYGTQYKKGMVVLERYDDEGLSVIQMEFSIADLIMTDDMESVDLVREIVAKALPYKKGETLDEIVEKLKEDGLMDEEDFKFLQEEDLLKILPAVQARRLIAFVKAKDFVRSTNPTSPTTCTSDDTDEISISPVGSPSTSGSSSPVVPCFASPISGPDWETYAIPWEKLPPDFMVACRKGRAPEPSSRREMVRIFSKDIRSRKNLPGRAALRTLSKRMVALYPRSFENRLPNGVLVDNGIVGLVTAFENCIFNLMRSDKATHTACTARFLLKRLDANVGENAELVQPVKKIKIVHDSYGCVNWQPGKFDEGENDETQTQKQEWLKTENEKPIPDMKNVKEFMSSTYPSQWLFLNRSSSPSTTEVMKEWPFLFNFECMMAHFETLMGFGLEETLANNLQDNVDGMCEFFEELSFSSKNKLLRKCVKDMKQYDGNGDGHGGGMQRLVGAILCLIAYFGEEESIMCIYFEVPDIATAKDVENAHKIPTTPFIAVRGPNAFLAKRFFLVIDKKVVNDDLHSFMDALKSLFASFYILNIRYSPGIAVTLEFMQRILAMLNPGKREQDRENCHQPKDFLAAQQTEERHQPLECRQIYLLIVPPAVPCFNDI